MANYYFNPADHAVGTSLTDIGWTSRWVDRVGDSWLIAEPTAGQRVVRYTKDSGATGRVGLSWNQIDSDGNRANVEMLIVGRSIDSESTNLRMLARASGAAASETGLCPGVSIGTNLLYTLNGYNAGSPLTVLTGTQVTGAYYNTWVATRVRVNGNDHSFKTWFPADIANPTADEPAGWQRTASNSTVTAAGWVGLFRFDHGNYEILKVAFATGGDTAAFSAPSSTPVAFSGSVSNQTGTEGTAFSLNLSTYFSGTETPFAYSVQAGTLPAGLSFNSSTGVISGTPTTAGVSSGIVIRATDATPDTADTNGFSITINAANTSPSFTGPNIDNISGTEGVALTPVDVSAKFFDSESGLTFSAVGSWPAGVTVSSAGVISGTPTTAGTYSGLQVRATDAGALTADSNAFTITVAAPLAAGINVTEPLKNNTGTLLASQSGVRVAVLQAADLVSVYETSGLTTNASGVLATISDAAITAGQQYHVAIKLADGGVGITGPITAS